jgi:hypothetical protein
MALLGASIGPARRVRSRCHRRPVQTASSASTTNSRSPTPGCRSAGRHAGQRAPRGPGRGRPGRARSLPPRREVAILPWADLLRDDRGRLDRGWSSVHHPEHRAGILGGTRSSHGGAVHPEWPWLPAEADHQLGGCCTTPSRSRWPQVPATPGDGSGAGGAAQGRRSAGAAGATGPASLRRSAAYRVTVGGGRWLLLTRCPSRRPSGGPAPAAR